MSVENSNQTVACQIPARYAGDHADAFVRLLTRGAPKRFATFHDSDKARKDAAKRLGPAPLAAVLPELQTHQADGCGIFVVVNDGGHKDDAVTNIVAVFIDMDDRPVLGPDGKPTGRTTPGDRWQDMTWHLRPSFLVVRDDTHWHAYWLVDDAFPVGRFTEVQKRLRERYDSDRKVGNRSRVMRVPGFKHLKDPKTPRDVALYVWPGETPRYSLAALTAALSELIDLDTGAKALRARPDLELDLPHNVEHARRHLASLEEVSIAGAGGDDCLYRTSNILLDHGLSEEAVFMLLKEPSDKHGGKSWNARCAPPWDDDELETTIGNAASYRQNDPGCRATDPPSVKWAAWFDAKGSYRDEGVFTGADYFEDKPPPEFLMDALPDNYADFAEAIARAASDEANNRPAAAVSMLTVMCAAVDQRGTFKLTGEWSARPRMWSLLIGDSSDGKGVIADTLALKPLYAAHAVRKADHEKLIAARTAQVRQYEKEYPDGGADGPRYAPAKKALAFDPLKPPVSMVQHDATPAALAQLLQQDPHGFLVRLPDFSTWAKNLDPELHSKRGGDNALAFWLRVYDGGPWSAQRKTTDSVDCEHVSSCILADVQPGTLAKLGDLDTVGMLPRFIPVTMEAGGLVRTIPPETSAHLAAYGAHVTRLSRLPPAELRAEPGVVDYLADVRAELLKDAARYKRRSAGLNSYLTKLQNIVGSLTIVLHLAQHGTSEPVDMDTAHRVAAIVLGFMVPSGEYFYLGRRIRYEQRSIAAYVAFGTDKLELTPSDFTRNIHALHDFKASARELHARLEFLVNDGWCDDVRKPGKPFPVGYTVATNLREQLAPWREHENARVAEAREVIRMAIPTFRRRAAEKRQRDIEAGVMVPGPAARTVEETTW